MGDEYTIINTGPVAAFEPTIKIAVGKFKNRKRPYIPHFNKLVFKIDSGDIRFLFYDVQGINCYKIEQTPV